MADEVRLIDANALEKDFTDWYDRAYSRDKELIEIAILSVKDAPTIEAEPDNGWISVKDRLPDDNVDVLLHDTYCGTLMGWYDKQDGIFKSDYISRLDAVTRWIPLPEEPKGE